MQTPGPRSAARRFRARLGDRSFDITLTAGATEGAVAIDGRPVDVAFDPVGDATFALHVDGRSRTVHVAPAPDGRLRVTIDGRTVDVAVQDERALLMERFGLAAAETAGLREVRAPMPGLVLSVAVAPGQAVEAGSPLLVLEAMKMENELRAEAAGTVAAVHVGPGVAVGKNALLIEFEA